MLAHTYIHTCKSVFKKTEKQSSTNWTQQQQQFDGNDVAIMHDAIESDLLSGSIHSVGTLRNVTIVNSSDLEFNERALN